MKQICMKYINFFAVMSICLNFSGCAISNEGATDYRHIDNNSSTKSKYIKPIAGGEIKPGEPLVISLKQIFINNFVEFRSPLRWVRGEPANGEVVVVVNAFEMGKGERADFSPTGKENARVVFFSDDVWEGQFLNVSNLSTIYGPLKYDGGSFMLDLYVVEMDTPGEQLRQLLSNLAAIGSTFYPPAAPIAGPLAQLAGTLIQDDQDDRAYHHSAEFKPLGGDPNVHTGILRTGDYIFIREEERDETTKWHELDLDKNNGRVIYSHTKPGMGHCKPGNALTEDCYYKENSYVVVEINTAASSIKNDATQMIYKELSTKVFSNAAPIFKTAVPEEALQSLAIQVKKTRSSESIASPVIKLENKSNSLVERTVAADQFINLWTEKDGDNLKHQLSDVDKSRIEERIARLLSSCAGNNQQKVLDMMKRVRTRNVFADSDNDIVTALVC